jgi:hypothetical protein
LLRRIWAFLGEEGKGIEYRRGLLDLYNYRRYSKGTFPFLCMCMYVYLLRVFIFLSLTDLLMDDLGKD